jgi:hypothetical protein
LSWWRSSLCLLAAQLLLTLGCSSLDPSRFQSFSTSLQELTTGVEAQADQDYTSTRARFVAEAGTGKIALTRLQLSFDADDSYGFSYAEGEPLFVKVHRFQLGIGRLNQAMQAYAALLVELAGGELIPQARFDQLTRDLNANAAAAARTLGMEVSGQDLGLISTTAVEVLRGLLEQKRRRALAEAVAANQERIEQFAGRMEEAIELLAAGVRQDYTQQYMKIALAAVDAPDRTDAVNQILALNQQTEESLRMLRSLAASYRALPAAHAALARDAGQAAGLGGLVDLANHTLHLRALWHSVSPPEAESE